MKSDEILKVVIERVKEIHTYPRAGGAPYWQHPVRCYKQLIEVWEKAPLEVQIAMLFHDTLEDLEQGEQIITKTLDETSAKKLSLGRNKVFELVQNVTTPHNVSKEQAIEQITERFQSGNAHAEAYLIKALDIQDNTSDLLHCYQEMPDDPEVKAHMSHEKWKKYSGYLKAIDNGWHKHYDENDRFEGTGMKTALVTTIKQIETNLNEIAGILKIE